MAYLALGSSSQAVRGFAFERQGAILDLFGILHPAPVDECLLLLLPGTLTAWAPGTRRMASAALAEDPGTLAARRPRE